MLRETGIITTTYETGHEDFMIDIVESRYIYEAWLYREAEGRKDIMFGIEREFWTMEEFLNKVEELLPKYIKFYDEETESIENMHLAECGLERV